MSLSVCEREDGTVCGVVRDYIEATTARLSVCYTVNLTRRREKLPGKNSFDHFRAVFWGFFFACVCAFLTGKVVGELAGKKGDGTHYHAPIRVEQSFESNSDDSCGIVCKLFQNCESKLIKTRPRSPDEAD